jgi:hypothetical protein
MRNEYNGFLESDKYIFMFKDSEIAIHPKGTTYKKMEGNVDKI